MLKHLRQNEDGWSWGYPSLHICDEAIAHQGSLDDVGVIRASLPEGFRNNVHHQCGSLSPTPKHYP